MCAQVLRAYVAILTRALWLAAERSAERPVRGSPLLREWHLVGCTSRARHLVSLHLPPDLGADPLEWAQ